MDHNTFRQIDAFEYVDAYKRAVRKQPAAIRKLLENLNARMEKVGFRHDLLAAYRGYEDALTFKECGLRSDQEQIVILDQSVDTEREQSAKVVESYSIVNNEMRGHCALIAADIRAGGKAGQAAQ